MTIRLQQASADLLAGGLHSPFFVQDIPSGCLLQPQTNQSNPDYRGTLHDHTKKSQNLRTFPETFLQKGGNTALTECIRRVFKILDLVLGIAVGFFHKGKEDYYGLLKTGVIVGLVLGIIFVLAAKYVISGGSSIDFGSLGTPGFFIEIFLFLVIFILGAFIGDKIEQMVRK
jgi:hypothetical protein